MAIEINANGDFGESVHLSGADAENFVREISHPSTDQRRLSHLARSDAAYERIFSPEPLSDLPPSE
jgi:hypothetical protein